MIGEARKMKVKQLKEMIKIMTRGKARQYPLTRKKKSDLQQMVKDLQGGGITDSIRDALADWYFSLFARQ